MTFCYIRDIATWTHLARWQVVDYSLPVWSAADESGSITVAGEVDDLTGNWLLIDGKIYLLSKSAPAKHMTKLTVRLPCHAFDRMLIYAGSGTEYYGTFIVNQIVNKYIEQTDPVYAMPYLSVSSDNTPSFIFPVTNGSVFKLSDIWMQAEAAGVRFTLTPTTTGLSLSITMATLKTVNLFPGDGHTQIDSQSWASTLLAKVTVRQVEKKNDVLTVLASGIYYWHPDGTVSATAPEERIRGEWKIVDVKPDVTLLDGAKAAMASNTSSYKLTLRTDRTDLAMGDTALVRLPGRTVSVSISSCIASSKDRRPTVKCGTMTTTLTDVIASISQPPSVSVDGISGMELLWTNPSPSAEYAGATVSLDLNRFSSIMVEFKGTTTSVVYPNAVIPVGRQSPLITFVNFNSANALYTSYRTANVSQTGVVFSAGYRKSVQSTAAYTQNNASSIPTRIWGIP